MHSFHALAQEGTRGHSASQPQSPTRPEPRSGSRKVAGSSCHVLSDAYFALSWSQQDVAGACRAEVVEVLREAAQGVVMAYPALSLSIAYINASSTSMLHFSGALVPQPHDDSMYELESITKTFTGSLVAAAVAAAHVTLDTPVKVLATPVF